MRVYRLSEPQANRFLARTAGRGDVVVDDTLRARVAKTVSSIRRRGDQALLRHIRNDDLQDVSPPPIRTAAGPTAASEELGDAVRWALNAALEETRRVHLEHTPTADCEGNGSRRRTRAVGSVGLVLPHRRHPDLVRLIGSLVPARIAGVPRLAVAVSPGCYLDHASLRYLLDRLEVDDVYLMSGPHAVAALAFGTDTVEATDMIVAGGSAELIAAAQAVAPHVATDPRGGIPELMVIADQGSDVDLVAADLLAHVEDSAEALALVVTTSRRFARQLNPAVRSRLRRLPRSHPAREALRRWGAILIADDEEGVGAVVDRLRPARVHLMTSDPSRLEDRLEGAALVTVGPSAPPAVLGLTGACAVLPCFGLDHGPLTTTDFERVTCRVEVPDERYAALAAASALLAESQGLSLAVASLTAGVRDELP
jgi:histidinol dehydrogenase